MFIHIQWFACHPVVHPLAVPTARAAVLLLPFTFVVSSRGWLRHFHARSLWSPWLLAQLGAALPVEGM